MLTSSEFRTTIPHLDTDAAFAARERIDQLTKPQGSLGRIEDLAVQLAAIAGELPRHAYERRAILVGAGDHGVAVEGVSAYPPEVTAQMVDGFLEGFAAINAFGSAVRAHVYVADFGVREKLAQHPNLLDVKVGYGTANLAKYPAIAADDVERSLIAGTTAFNELYRKAAFDVLAVGEMGIGNTTSAAAVTAAFTGATPGEVVGRGTGIDDQRLARKIALVEKSLRRLKNFTWQEIAGEVGGYEIVGLAGVILSAARARVPVILDGYIVAAAALIAHAIAPQAIGYCIAAHRSREAGHAIALQALGLRPLFDLDLALGEASGAALALPMIEASARMMREMRTFAEAGVSGSAS